jgi:hypothetical protein
MHSPALALSRQLWGRHRYGLAAVLLYVTAMAVAFNVLPAGEEKTQHAAVVSIQFVAGLIYVAAVFAYGFDLRLEAPQSCFPARLFTLPVRTVGMVAAPMLQGVALVVLLWLAWAYLVLRPAGIDVSPWSTALQAAAFVIVLQALLWAPFGLPWLRVVLALVLLPLLALAPQLGALLGANELLLDCMYAALVPIGALAAFAGVSRARHGASGQWPALFQRSRPSTGRFRQRAAFGSPAAAQLWLERRLHLLPLPLTVAGLVALFFLVTLILERPPEDFKSQLTLALNLCLFPTIMAPLFGSFLGAMGTSPGTRHQLPAFIATRPLPVTALVAAKLKVAALAAATACAMAFAAAAVWIVAAGSGEQAVKAAADFLRAYPFSRAAATVLFVVVAPGLLTWRLLVDNLWIGLTGRAWIARGSLLVGGLALTALALLAARFMSDPALAHQVWEVLPWWAGVAALVKLLAAAWAGRALLRRGLIERRALLRLLGVWAVTALGLFGLARGTVLFDDVPLSLLASGAVLIVPLVRLAAAPLALAWNRHR